MRRGPAEFVVAALLGLLLAGLPAGAAEKLQLAVEDAAAPWSRGDGTGYANDIVVAAYRAAGVEVELTVVPYERCKHLVVRGDVPACFSMSWLPEFEPTVVFPDEPLFTCTAAYYQAVARPVKASRQEELPRGTVVGTTLGYEYPPKFYELERAGVIVAEKAPSEELNLKKLAAGRVDLALVNVDLDVKRGEDLVRRAGVVGEVRPAFVGGVLRSFIGFSKKHPRGAWARARFEEGFRRIRADGTVARIGQAWRAPAAVEPEPPPRSAP
jgi:ABC-type amino acid transport substrate-binding protein